MNFLLLIVAAFLAVILLLLKKHTKKINIILKILVVIYFVVGFARLFLPDDFILVINGAYDYSIFFNSTDYLSSILRWGYQTSLIILPVSIFFKDNKYMKRIVVYYCLPFLILNILTYDTHMAYFLKRDVLNIRYHDPFGFGKLSDSFRHVQFSLELGLATALAMFSAFDFSIYKMKAKEVFNFFAILIPVILLSLPIYVPQSLFGYGNFMLTGFTLQNLIWILMIIAIVFTIYFIFRNQKYEHRLIVGVTMSLALFVLYNSMYITGITIPRLPVQLCNLACYLTLFAIIFKWQKVFDFILIANILGTIIAIMVPDVSTGVFSFFHFHFLYEHMLVFIVPIVMVSLGLFKRPTIKSLKHALIGFSIYFVFCLGIGMYLNSIKSVTGYSVNYFYMFKDEVLQVFPFLSFTRKYPLVINDYIGYPLYQLMIYLMFSLGCVGLYYVTMWLYKVSDDHKQLRLIRKEEKRRKTEKIERDRLRNLSRVTSSVS